MPEDQRRQVLVGQAQRACKRIERECKKAPKEVQCQRNLHRYAP